MSSNPANSSCVCLSRSHRWSHFLGFSRSLELHLQPFFSQRGKAELEEVIILIILAKKSIKERRRKANTGTKINFIKNSFIKFPITTLHSKINNSLKRRHFPSRVGVTLRWDFATVMSLPIQSPVSLRDLCGGVRFVSTPFSFSV